MPWGCLVSAPACCLRVPVSLTRAANALPVLPCFSPPPPPPPYPSHPTRHTHHHHQPPTPTLPPTEDKVLLRALRDFNLGKLTADDTSIFLGLLSDLFPRTLEHVPRAIDTAFESKVTGRRGRKMGAEGWGKA